MRTQVSPLSSLRIMLWPMVPTMIVKFFMLPPHKLFWLSHFLAERLFQHPVYNLLDCLCLFTKKPMRAEGLARLRLRRRSAEDGYQRIFLHETRCVSIGSHDALIAHVVREQHGRFDAREIESAQTRPRLFRPAAGLAKHRRGQDDAGDLRPEPSAQS